jgi:hypothetical protein
MKNVIPFHYCPHFVLCKDEVQGESFPKKASLQNPGKKNTHHNNKCVSLKSHKLSKLENKIQP